MKTDFYGKIAKPKIPFVVNLRFWEYHRHDSHVQLPFHSHFFWQLNMVEEGQAEFVASKEKLHIELNPGDLLFIPPNCTHLLHYDRGVFVGLSFKMEVHGLTDCADRPIHIPSSPQTIGCVKAIKELLIATFPTNNIFSGETLLNCDDDYSLLVESLLSGLFQRYVAGSGQNATSPLLRNVRQLLLQRHGQPLSVQELAKFCSYSAGHLSELLFQECGLRAKPLIDRERTVIAANFLEFSEMNINEIAEYMGFPNVFAFSAFFRRHTGIAPSIYRSRKRNQLPSDSGPAIQERKKNE